MTEEKRQLPIEFDHLTPTLVPQGTTLFGVGDQCQQFVYVVSGSIRVDLASESGASLLLYRLNSSDTCVLTTSCLMSGDQYCAEATVEEDAVIVIMPASEFYASIEGSALFRSFVFSSFSKRLTALMLKVDEVAFRSIERRLAGSLLHHAKERNTVRVTHDVLASEIGTAREVISRKLAQWDSAKIISRGRGEITLLSLDQLNAIAGDIN